jgi:Leucine-rich repeat (LRR) protein
LNCIEKTYDDFINDLKEVKETYVLRQMIELTVKNKLIKNISNSNISSLLTLNIKSLWINDCKINTINKGTFSLMSNLNSLSLARNEISSIENDTFSNSNELFDLNIRELYLTGNKLNRIKCGVFKSLFKLEILFIDANQIEDIELNSFEHLNELKQINLKQNRIKLFDSNIFSVLNKLEVIDLDKNEIEQFDSKTLSKLRQLHLHSNKIGKIPNKLFAEMISLEVLYLYQNNIDTIETIPFNTLYSLRKLHISSNKITSIKFGNFIHLVKLEELKLDKNEITSLGANTFIGLESLLLLDLSCNKINLLDNRVFDGLLNLKRLDLSLNDIDQIGMYAFLDLKNLDYLNLDSNKIFSLKNVIFNSKLTVLSVRFNMLSSLNEINSTSLKQLYVTGNYLQTLTQTISSLPALEHLDLSQNRLISIREYTFSHMKKLKNLNLSFNKLDLETSYFRNQNLLQSLDLSFNEIKYLSSQSGVFQELVSLKYLNLSNNKLKTIVDSSFIFESLSKLSELNLAWNGLIYLKENCFSSLDNLKSLSLGFNRINSLNFLNQTKSLVSLDLEQNEIVSIDDLSAYSIEYLNLNSNPLKQLPLVNRFYNLKTLKLSNTPLDCIYVNRNLQELDLSHTNISILNLDQLDITWINLANFKMKKNFSFYRLFLTNQTRHVDFSYNSFTNEEFEKMFDMLDSPWALETLKLRQTNLKHIDGIIEFKNLPQLKLLDLSLNNLTYISSDTFEHTTYLEYLDLSSNRLREFTCLSNLNHLRHINLENNSIEFSASDMILVDFYSIETLKLGQNRLRDASYPSFDLSQLNAIGNDTFLEINLDRNQLRTVKYFSYTFGKLKMASFDSNNITRIDTDAFLNCRSLEYLSIASNRLTRIDKNDFHFLFSLTHLNLSSNEIVYIEANSFVNLNKLKTLDLSSNRLVAIENDLFFGLKNLNHLLLTIRTSDDNVLTIYNRSFKHLPNLSTLVLNANVIEKYKCILMHDMQRDVQRNIRNRYVFYKSINLLCPSTGSSSRSIKCDLMFHLFQFNVHYDLRTDTSIEKFYSACQKIVIKRENTYRHNYKKCFSSFEFDDRVDDESVVQSLHQVLRVLSDFQYLLVMGLLLVLIGPVFCMILKYELFGKSMTNQLDNENSLNTNIQRDITIARREITTHLVQETNVLSERLEESEEVVISPKIAQLEK